MFRSFTSAAIALSWVWVTVGLPAAATVNNNSPPSLLQDGRSPTASASYEAGDEANRDRPLAVLGIAAGHQYEQGQALAWALRRAVETSVEWKNAEADYSMDALLSSLGCSEVPDIGCLSRISGKTNLSRFVWGTLQISRGRVHVDLGLFDDAKVTAQAHLEYTAKMTDSFDEDLLRLANAGLGQLLGPLHYPVIVHSRERVGEITIDDAVVGKLSEGVGNVAATAGDHQIYLKLPDATTIARTFQVRVEHATMVRLDFIDVPESRLFQFRDERTRVADGRTAGINPLWYRPLADNECHASYRRNAT
jgi:hypothetical protein